MLNPRNIVVYTPTRFSNEIWLPALWAQAKTYYKRHGKNTAKWHWVPCYADVHGDDIAAVQTVLAKNPPDVFAISLYVWNTNVAHEVAAWVKSQWPNCVIISGGPHQYFKHDINWFKNHPYLDASLPGDCYGEPFITDVLDNYDELDWASIAGAYYPKGKNRLVAASTTEYQRRDFDFSWSAFHEQAADIEDFLNYKKHHAPLALLLSILETTRGCPYGCTYCDWGGGINTKVVNKPVSAVELDIAFLCKLNLNYLYIADANFGILKERDIGIIKYLADQRTKHNQKFSLGYGGFAKSENRIEYIKQILKIDIKNNLSNFGEIKISLQSLDDEVLKNIDRKNITLAAQMQMANELVGDRTPVYAELILGLPGTSLDKFYHELDVLGAQGISAIWYEWILLPEAPAYDYAYREKYGIQVVEKRSGWYTPTKATNKHEIVVAGAKFSTDDYLDMLLASSLFKCIIQGGIYKSSINHIVQKRHVGHGELCRMILNFFNQRCADIRKDVQRQWDHSILADIDTPCFFTVGSHEVFGGLYFVALCYLYPEQFAIPLGDWLIENFACPDILIADDRRLLVNVSNNGTSVRQGWRRVHYQIPGVSDFDSLIKCFMQFKNTGNAMIGYKRLF